MVKTIISSEIFLEPHNRLGEGPLYDSRSDILAWVDIRGEAVHWVDYSKGSSEAIWKTHKWVSTGISIGVLGLTKTPLKFVAASQLGFAVIDLSKAAGEGEKVEVQSLKEIHGSAPNMRFNDGIVDPQGNFIAGSLANFGEESGPLKGKLYRYSPAGELEVIVDNARTPNGIGFSPDLRYMYWTDTPTTTIFRFDYNATTGELSNRQAWLVPQLQDVDETNPDGLCLSEDGDIWIAFWGASRVQRYSDSGELKEIYKFPAERCSCPTFAGKDLDELVVTSASLRLDDPDFKHIPGEKDKGGELFRIKIPGVKGLNRFVFPLE